MKCAFQPYKRYIFDNAHTNFKIGQKKSINELSIKATVQEKMKIQSHLRLWPTTFPYLADQRGLFDTPVTARPKSTVLTMP